MPYFWKRHLLTVLPVFENISPAFLRRPGLSVCSLHWGNPPLRGASLEGTTGRRWSSGDDGESSAAVPSSAAPPRQGWRTTALAYFMGSCWMRWKLEANDPLGPHGEHAKRGESKTSTGVWGALPTFCSGGMPLTWRIITRSLQKSAS